MIIRVESVSSAEFDPKRFKRSVFGNIGYVVVALSSFRYAYWYCRLYAEPRFHSILHNIPIRISIAALIFKGMNRILMISRPEFTMKSTYRRYFAVLFAGLELAVVILMALRRAQFTPQYLSYSDRSTMIIAACWDWAWWAVKNFHFVWLFELWALMQPVESLDLMVYLLRPFYANHYYL